MPESDSDLELLSISATMKVGANVEAQALMHDGTDVGISKPKEKPDTLVRWSWVGGERGPAPNVSIARISGIGWVSGGTDIEGSDILASCAFMTVEFSAD